MQLSTRFGFAFLCMPKCASTSIESAIGKYCNVKFGGHAALKHISAQMYATTILPVHQALVSNVKIESFCLMRDPLAWIESWYRFRARPQLQAQDHPNHAHYTGDMSYQAFIEAYLTSGRRPPFANIGTQSGFLQLDTGQLGVDYIFPMSRLDLVARFLSQKIGRDIEIPTKNTSEAREAALDSATLARLEAHLAGDIRLYRQVEENGVLERSGHGG